MFTEKDILTRLQAGESIQDIANELTDVLNRANKAHAAEVKAAEEAKIKAEEAAKQLAIQKKEELEVIMDLVVEWLRKHYDMSISEDLALDANDMLEILDESINEIKKYADAFKELEGLLNIPKAKKSAAKTESVQDKGKKKDADMAINEFLKDMGWL